MLWWLRVKTASPTTSPVFTIKKHMAKKTLLVVDESEISIVAHSGQEYISLTDIAKKFGEPRIVIQNWMRARNTIHFLGVWETIHNPDFNRIEFDAFINDSGTNAFTMSPSKWIEGTNAKGIISKAGRTGGGTFAQKDIALGFCYWISPPFQLYLIQEFQRLKEQEAADHREALDWNLKRTLAKVNYLIHTDAVKMHLIPPRLVGTKQEGIVYASQADILNLALFGMTAKQWREANPNEKGNIRDEATTEQLLVLSNLENLNAHFIKEGLPPHERLQKLNETAIYQMELLTGSRKLRALKQLPGGKDKG